MDAINDRAYMTWWRQNGAMNNPDIEYPAWIDGRRTRKSLVKFTVMTWWAFPGSFTQEDRELLVSALNEE